MTMQYYRIWGAPTGLFPAWTDYGWFYGSPQHISELYGYLLQAGQGLGYMFAAYDVNNVPVMPIMPGAQPGGSTSGIPRPQWPTIPGLSFPQAA